MRLRNKSTSSLTVSIISFFRRETRLNFKKFINILEETGQVMLEVGVICAVAGVVIGTLTLTGLAFTFTLIVEQLSAGNLFLILALTAVISLILGMGMPTTAVYVIVALTLAPALEKLEILPISAHLFVFYWAMLSLYTPPICVAAFAAAAIARSAALRTGFTCMRLGIIAYLIPFVMVFDPLLLLRGPAALVILAIATASAGTIAIGMFKKVESGKFGQFESLVKNQCRFQSAVGEKQLLRFLGKGVVTVLYHSGPPFDLLGCSGSFLVTVCVVYPIGVNFGLTM